MQVKKRVENLTFNRQSRQRLTDDTVKLLAAATSGGTLQHSFRKWCFDLRCLHELLNKFDPDNEYGWLHSDEVVPGGRDVGPVGESFDSIKAVLQKFRAKAEFGLNVPLFLRLPGAEQEVVRSIVCQFATAPEAWDWFCSADPGDYRKAKFISRGHIGNPVPRMGTRELLGRLSDADKDAWPSPERMQELAASPYELRRMLEAKTRLSISYSTPAVLQHKMDSAAADDEVLGETQPATPLGVTRKHGAGRVSGADRPSKK